MAEVKPEGWYYDPFGRHQHRWFSEGTATSLVRDAGVEARDEPPGDSLAQSGPEPIDPGAGEASDLRRADDSTQPAEFDSDAALFAGLDAAAQQGCGSVGWRIDRQRKPG
jgi:hypothetical protein